MSKFQTYVINLDRSTDRLAEISELLSELGVQFERVPAVEGAKLDLEDPGIRQKIDFNHWAKFHHRNMLPAELGCYLSHIRVLEVFIDSPNQYALVLEDDADLAKDLPQVLSGLMRHTDKWDLVKLHSGHPGYQRYCEDLDHGNVLTSFVTQTGRSTAYVISREAAIKLHKQLHPVRLPFDHIFDRNFEHGLKLRGVMPMPVKNRPVLSTIQTEKKKRSGFFPAKWGDPPLLPRWRVPFYRAWTETRRLYHNLMVDTPRQSK